jgi:hypothetical protein
MWLAVQGQTVCRLPIGDTADCQSALRVMISRRAPSGKFPLTVARTNGVMSRIAVPAISFWTDVLRAQVALFERHESAQD